jgi:L-alanine-DL-glutamate epimerase-like enolase superfamily enzyme
MDFYWYEDPLGDHDIYNYKKLKEKLDIPIMATERPIAGFDSYAIWITERATDYLRGDVAIKGGITSLIKTAHLAEAFAMNYEVHVGGNSINNLANLQVELAIRNTEFHEILMPETAAVYGLLNEPTVDSEGYIHPPQGPGLGAEIDFDLIKSKTIAVLA